MSTPLEIAGGVAVEMLVLVLAMGLLYRVFGKFFAVSQRRTILPFQRGVLLKGEAVRKVLGPGTFWISPKQTLLLCDVRSKAFQVPGIELVTLDRMGVRVSVGGEYRISNPAAFFSESSDGFGAFYVDIKQALHAAVAELHGKAFLDGHVLLALRVKELLVPRSSQLGIEMTQLDVWEAVPLGWLR